MSRVDELKKSTQEMVNEQGYDVSPYMLEYYMQTALNIVKLINKSSPSKKDTIIILGIVLDMYELISLESKQM